MSIYLTFVSIKYILLQKETFYNESKEMKRVNQANINKTKSIQAKKSETIHLLDAARKAKIFEIQDAKYEVLGTTQNTANVLRDIIDSQYEYWMNRLEKHKEESRQLQGS